MDIKKIKELIDLMEKRNLSEIEVHEGNKSIHLKRGGAPNGAISVITDVVKENPPVSASVSSGLASPKSEEVSAGSEKGQGHILKSPFVGTFYLSASPNEPPFIKPGQSISKGQTLCIVEAMKLMNEIESDVDGVVREILVENGKPVEYGEPLLRIDPM